MASLKQLRNEVRARSRQARRELEQTTSLWRGAPGDTLRAAGLIAGGFGVGVLVGGGRRVPVNAIWRMLLAGVPAVLQELLDARPAAAAEAV